MSSSEFVSNKSDETNVWPSVFQRFNAQTFEACVKRKEALLDFQDFARLLTCEDTLKKHICDVVASLLNVAKASATMTTSEHMLKTRGLCDLQTPCLAVSTSITKWHECTTHTNKSKMFEKSIIQACVLEITRFMRSCKHAMLLHFQEHYSLSSSLENDDDDDDANGVEQDKEDKNKDENIHFSGTILMKKNKTFNKRALFATLFVNLDQCLNDGTIALWNRRHLSETIDKATRCFHMFPVWLVQALGSYESNNRGSHGSYHANLTETMNSCCEQIIEQLSKECCQYMFYLHCHGDDIKANIRDIIQYMYCVQDRDGILRANAFFNTILYGSKENANQMVFWQIFDMFRCQFENLDALYDPIGKLMRLMIYNANSMYLVAYSLVHATPRALENMYEWLHISPFLKAKIQSIICELRKPKQSEIFGKQHQNIKYKIRIYFIPSIQDSILAALSVLPWQKNFFKNDISKASKEFMETWLERHPHLIVHDSKKFSSLFYSTFLSKSENCQYPYCFLKLIYDMIMALRRDRWTNVVKIIPDEFAISFAKNVVFLCEFRKDSIPLALVPTVKRCYEYEWNLRSMNVTDWKETEEYKNWSRLYALWNECLQVQSVVQELFSLQQQQQQHNNSSFLMVVLQNIILQQLYVKIAQQYTLAPSPCGFPRLENTNVEDWVAKMKFFW